MALRFTNTILLLSFFVFQAFGQTTTSVELRWLPYTQPGFVLDQYRIHWGTSPGNYTTNLCAGTNLTDTIDGLEIGKTYHFAVTALDTNTMNIETPFSNEIAIELRSSGLRLVGFLAKGTGDCKTMVSNMTTNSGFGYTQWVLSTASRYLATPFVSDGLTVCEVSAALQSVGNLQGTVSASIWSGTTSPVARIGPESAPVDISTMPRMATLSMANAIVEKITFQMPDIPIPPGTNWLVLRGSGMTSSSNYLLWWRNSFSAGVAPAIMSSVDAITWSKPTSTRRGLHTIGGIP